MLNTIYNNIGVVVLAAGRGSRLGCVDVPKAMLEIGDKPMVSYIVKTLEDLGLPAKKIVLVVGYKKEKIINYFLNRVVYAIQNEQLGTAHAAYTGVKNLEQSVTQLLILGGDDSAFYKSRSLLDFIDRHLKAKAVLSVLSVEKEKPDGFGRIIRDDEGNFQDILEKEEISEEQKKISEINTGAYLVDRFWFEEVFPNLGKIEKIGEYGMNEVVVAAKEQNKKIQIVKLENNNEWFGINTPEELVEADRLKHNQ